VTFIIWHYFNTTQHVVADLARRLVEQGFLAQACGLILYV
jgi:hypothetical protein